MAVYLFWGDDDYGLAEAVRKLSQTHVDSAWRAFNEQRYSDWQDALGDAITPPFGSGDRVVIVSPATVAQQCNEAQYDELARTLKVLPESTHLIFCSSSKPDGRLKATKLLNQVATVKEFSQIPAWDHDRLEAAVKHEAATQQVALTADAIAALATAVGCDRRRLAMELEKLSLLGHKAPLNAAQVAELVPATAANSFQLASALRQGDCDTALAIVAQMLDRNEPGLRILSVLVNQFRTWLWVRLLQDSGEKDPKVIAQAAEIGNPKRIYFLQKEVQGLSCDRLVTALDSIMRAEYQLKRGGVERGVLFQMCCEIAPRQLANQRRN